MHHQILREVFLLQLYYGTPYNNFYLLKNDFQLINFINIFPRLEVWRVSLIAILEKPIFGATLNGKSIYKKKLPFKAIYVFGNESNGISDSINEILDEKLTKPNQRLTQGANSLNVATSAAIFLSEIFR